ATGAGGLPAEHSGTSATRTESGMRQFICFLVPQRVGPSYTSVRFCQGGARLPPSRQLTIPVRGFSRGLTESPRLLGIRVSQHAPIAGEDARWHSGRDDESRLTCLSRRTVQHLVGFRRHP